MPVENCKEIATIFFEKNKPKSDSIFCEIRIFQEYNDKNAVVDKTINNRVEYETFKKEQEEQRNKKALLQAEKATGKDALIVENLNNISCRDTLNYFDKRLKEAKKKDKLKIQNEAFLIAMKCISVDSVYDYKKIEEHLVLCKKITNNYLAEGSNTFLDNLKLMIETLDKITNVMKIQKTVEFDRKKYFGTAQKNDIKQGIEELIKINNKQK
jgi:hypothetical protein